MKTVIITGSTRGIGRGMAHEFLARGCRVVVNGRSQASVGKALAWLGDRHDPAHMAGQPADMSDYAQVQALWEAAQTHFGRVDIWVNNAALGDASQPFTEQSPEHIERVVGVNLVGTMYACRVAIIGMMAQQPAGGHIYNMEGFGSGGRTRAGVASYATTKRALRYFSKALLEETKGTPVKVSRLSPGIVVTDLLMDGYAQSKGEQKQRATRIFNALGDRVETVTPYLVERILANDKTGAFINWLSTTKVIRRLVMSLFRKRDVFDAD